MSKTIEARCTICDHEVESTEGLTGCPKCGTKSLPCSPKEDVTVKVNWHELTVLCNWAMFWANQHEATSQPETSMQQTIYSIVRRLETQHPEIRKPLTLGGEIRQLKAEGLEIESNVPHEPLFDPTDEG
jgi:hypothetical protein